MENENEIAETAALPPAVVSYGDRMAAGERAEREGRLCDALEEYDEAIHRRRKQKLSAKEPSVAYNRVVAEVRLRAAARGIPLDDTTDPFDVAQALDKMPPKATVTMHVAGQTVSASGDTATEIAGKLAAAVQTTTEEGPVKTKKTKATKKPKTDANAGEARLLQLETERVKKNGLKPGAKLLHAVRGFVQAELVFVGPRQWRYDGRTFTSISDAANAHSADMKSKSRSLNGWIYWGVEKRGA